MSTLRLSPAPVILSVHVRYAVRRAVREPRAIATGVVLPVLLLALANPGPHAAAGRVAGLAVLGSGMAAWTTHGIALVASRESGELRRWWAGPAPRWCYLAARIGASVLVATAGGLITVLAGIGGWDVPFHLSSLAAATGVLVLGTAAWAAAATAMTGLVPAVEAAWPVLGLVYLPIVLTSGAFGTVPWPWLRSAGAFLPARPMADTLGAALGAGPVNPVDIMTLAGWAIFGLLVAVATFRWDPSPPADSR